MSISDRPGIGSSVSPDLPLNQMARSIWSLSKKLVFAWRNGTGEEVRQTRSSLLAMLDSLRRRSFTFVKDGVFKPMLAFACTSIISIFLWIKNRYGNWHRRNYVEGRRHVHLGAILTMALVLASAGLSTFTYSYFMRTWQVDLAKAYSGTPVIRLILDDSSGEAFVPNKTIDRSLQALKPDVMEFSRDGKTFIFSDKRKPTRNELFEVVKTLEIVDRDRTLEEFFRPNNAQPLPDDVPVRDLIQNLEAVIGEKEMREIGPLWLAAVLAGKVGTAYSGDPNASSTNCWAAALAQILSAYPGRWEEFTVQARGNVKNLSVGKAGCPWLGDGSLASAPELSNYMLLFQDTPPGEIAIARALLVMARAIPVEELHNPTDDKSASPDKVASPDKDVSPKPSNSVRLAEIFIRRLLSRAAATPDVKRERFWLDMLVGWPQALLNWVTVMLTMLILARMMLLRKFRFEISHWESWLETKQDKLEEPDPVKRTGAARLLAAQLDEWLAKGRPRKRWKKEVRPNSLATLMASKAIKRLVVGESQPDLFRDFCNSRRALVDESAWFLRYLSRALPALGFIGIILGILYALNGTDGIVGATGVQERVSAMVAVTGPLAFAFSHTFIALSAGLVTGFLVDRQSARERQLLIQFEEKLIDTIDVAERDAAPAEEQPGGADESSAQDRQTLRAVEQAPEATEKQLSRAEEPPEHTAEEELAKAEEMAAQTAEDEPPPTLGKKNARRRGRG